MAQPSRYQYVSVVGPVWREPVAERLAWLPRGFAPQIALERRPQGFWVVDPTVLIPVVFDAALFPHATLALRVLRDLPAPLRTGFFITDPTTPAAGAETRVVMIGSKVVLQRYTVVGATENITQIHGTTLVRR